MTRLSKRLTHRALRVFLAVAQGGRYRRLLDAAKTPEQVQTSVLNRILATNANTAFGKQHGFAGLRTVDDYRRAVPVQSYEQLRPLIERQELTGEACLTQEPPVYYHRTSGTVGAPKNIPMTASGLRRIRQQQKLFAYSVARASNALGGKIFGITGQAIEGTMPGGTPFGSASGLLYQSHAGLVRSRYVLPPELSDIEDYQARYSAMAAYGLSEASVTCVGTANPSTLVRLLALINTQPETILRAVADGSLPDRPLGTGLRPNPTRAAALSRRLDHTGQLTYADIWPELEAVTTWTGGSCAVPLRSLAASLPDRAKIVELGYVASEVHGTVNVDAGRNVCLPTLLDTVFEFAERRRWEDGNAEFLSLQELETDGEYYVFVTTAEGLYRYDMNDIVRVTGWVDQTPALAFVQKGKGVTNITGEKLYEAQVLDAVMATLADAGLRAHFFIMLADRDAARYTLYVEADAPDHAARSSLATDVDLRLRGLNIEYDSKRASDRLAPVALAWLRAGAGNLYRADRVAAGQRDAQFKYLHLQYAHECAFDFDALTESGWAECDSKR